MKKYINFDRRWFDIVVQNQCNEEEFYKFVDSSLTEFKTEKENSNYFKIPLLKYFFNYDSTEEERAKMFKALLIASYVSAQGKRDKGLEIKVMKFETIGAKFNMTIPEIGKLMEKFGKYNFCKIYKKKSRVGRPKMIYYIGFDYNKYNEEVNKFEF